MWTYNVTRGLLQASGKDVQPQQVPKSDEQVLQLAKQAIQDNEPRRVYTFKTHARIRPGILNSSYITVVRDIRDALVSWMRFMHSDFDKALNAAKDMTITIDHYNSFPRGKILHLAYNNIISDPNKACWDIANYLALDITDENIHTIVGAYSKKVVAHDIDKKEQEMLKQLQDNKDIFQQEFIRNFDGSLRFYDAETGFQSKHVTNYRDGDWQKILTEDQQRRMNDALGGWLEKHECFEVISGHS